MLEFAGAPSSLWESQLWIKGEIIKLPGFILVFKGSSGNHEFVSHIWGGVPVTYAMNQVWDSPEKYEFAWHYHRIS